MVSQAASPRNKLPAVSGEEKRYNSVGARAAERVRQKSAALAAAKRAEQDVLLGRHLTQGAAGSNRVASQSEQESLSVLLNHSMIDIFIDPQARNWYKLFVHMDDDCSGKVNYLELEDMVRNELKVPPSKLPTEQLKAVWNSLDEDNSGFITTGEFGSFMRIGSHVHNSEESLKAKILKKKEAEGVTSRKVHKEMISTWREAKTLTLNAISARTSGLRNQAGGGKTAVERLKQQNAVTAQSLRRELDVLRGTHKAKEFGGIRAATDAEVEQVATLLNQRMVDLFLDPSARSWYKLFVHMDDDCSGKISYGELEDMIRNELKVSSGKLAEETLKGVWKALDEDNSGMITCGEFGNFMRLGAHVHECPGGETGKAKFAQTKTSLGAVRRQEKLELQSARSTACQADEAAKRSRAQEHYEVSWGIRPPAERQAWRSPRAYIY